MIRHLTDALIAWGPAGILLLSILDSAGVPIPDGVDLLLMLTAAHRPDLAWRNAALAVIGSVAANIILFEVARRGGRRFMNAAAPKGWSGRFRAWFHRYGMITVFIPALMPIPMPLKVFVISAGVTGTSLSHFLLAVSIARVIRYFGEAWIAVRLGAGSTSFLKAHAWQFAVAAVLMFLALYSWVNYKNRARRKHTPA